MCMGRSLSIFKDVTFKMAAWRPYLIFRYLNTAVGMVSGASLNIALEFQFQISYACCLWLWAEAYWFSAMSLSKWPPGRHIGFFGFRTLTLVWLGISNPNFTGTSLVCMGEVYWFSRVIFKMAGWWPYLIFRYLISVVGMVSVVNSRLLWSFNFKFHMHVFCGHGPKPIDFQLYHCQNGRLAAMLNFSVSRF